jgi:hypothetical protein
MNSSFQLSQLNPEKALQVYTETIAKFTNAYQTRSLNHIHQSLQELDFLSTSKICFLTQDMKKQLVHPLFNFITEFPYIDLLYQVRAASLFVEISRDIRNRPFIEIDFDRFYHFVKKVFLKKNRLQLPAPDNANRFINFLSMCHYYFSETDGEKMRDMWENQIQFHDTHSISSFFLLMRFFPPRYGYKISDLCFSLLRQNPYPVFISSIFFF